MPPDPPNLHFHSKLPKYFSDVKENLASSTGNAIAVFSNSFVNRCSIDY